MRSLMLVAMSSCLVAGFLVSRVVTLVVVALLLMVSSPCRHLLLHVRVETRHVHAERLLAKAGVANGKVFERSFLGGPLAGEPKPAGRTALESARGDPLGKVWLPYSCASAHRIYRAGVA